MDIIALDLLPEGDPFGTADLVGRGLATCLETCSGWWSEVLYWWDTGWLG